METSEVLRSRLLSQQEALTAAISSLRAVTTRTGAGDINDPHSWHGETKHDDAGSDMESDEEENQDTLDAEEISRPTTDTPKEPEEVLGVKGGKNLRNQLYSNLT